MSLKNRRPDSDAVTKAIGHRACRKSIRPANWQSHRAAMRRNPDSAKLPPDVQQTNVPGVGHLVPVLYLSVRWQNWCPRAQVIAHRRRCHQNDTFQNRPHRPLPHRRQSRPQRTRRAPGTLLPRHLPRYRRHRPRRPGTDAQGRCTRRAPAGVYGVRCVGDRKENDVEAGAI